MAHPAFLAAASGALLTALVLGSGIAGPSLYEPDEARHAEIGREMLEASSWPERVTPRLDGAPYRNKPAPFYWLLAAMFGVFGVGELAARLPSVIADRKSVV